MRLEEPLAREFYIKEIEVNNWSVRELERQINSMLFERFALSKDKKGILKLAKKGQIIEKAADLVKDPYVLEFLNLEENPKYNESELEQRIIDNLKKFIMELGKGFMFVARQQRLTLDGDHFYIDLVFYNRILRCFVIIELKVGKLKHQDLGQLQMYVNYYDREIRKEDENLTIGILLCTDKKDTVVEYTLPENNKQIFASKYKSCLPDKKLLQKQVKMITEKEVLSNTKTNLRSPKE
jgi:predicted nuclease of restriction endonuclease-like (RecB) superfamily